MNPLPTPLLHTVVLTALSAALATFSGDAAPSTPPASSSQDPVTLAPGPHNTQELVKTLASLTGCNILVDSNDLGGNGITLQSSIRLTPQNAWEIIENLLYTQSLGIVPLSREHQIFELVNAQGSRRSRFLENATSMTPDEVLAMRERKTFVQCVLELEHVRANVAVNTLRPFFTTPGQMSPLTIGNVGNDHALILSGLTGQVAAAIELVRETDAATKVGEKRIGEELAARLESIEQRLQAVESR